MERLHARRFLLLLFHRLYKNALVKEIGEFREDRKLLEAYQKIRIHRLRIQ